MLAFENMHFAQSHLATIDTYAVFFIVAMYLFMYRYISSGYDAPFRKTLPALFLCGLSFGLGAATKWIAFYAALGLIALYAAYLVERGKYQISIGKKMEYRAFLRMTLAASAAFFVAVPALMYILSYIPYATANGQPLTAAGLLREMWDNQVYMLTFHGFTANEQTHEHQSRWYQWLLCLQPISYYSHFQEGGRTIVAAFTNPLVTIGGLAAIATAMYDFLRKRVKQALVIVVGYLAQLAPWILISRFTMAYHYYPSVVFLVLAICYVFNNMLKHCPEQKRRSHTVNGANTVNGAYAVNGANALTGAHTANGASIPSGAHTVTWVYIFTGVYVALFFLLLPPTAGIPMPDWYANWFARWLPSWPF